jgi:hypothetical protein
VFSQYWSHSLRTHNMGLRIISVLAAAVPNRWRPQPPEVQTDASPIVQGPTNSDNSASTSRQGFLPGQLDSASSSQIYGGARPSSSRGASSSPTRLRRDSILNCVPEEEGAMPPPAPGGDIDPVDEYDADQVEWELEEMGLYQGEHSTSPLMPQY